MIKVDHQVVLGVGVARVKVVAHEDAVHAGRIELHALGLLTLGGLVDHQRTERHSQAVELRAMESCVRRRIVIQRGDRLRERPVACSQRPEAVRESRLQDVAPCALHHLLHSVLAEAVGLGPVRGGGGVHHPHSLRGNRDLPGVVRVDPLARVVAQEVHQRGEGALSVLVLQGWDVLDVRGDVVDEQADLLTLVASRHLVLADDDMVGPEQVSEVLCLEVAEVGVAAACRGHVHLRLNADVALVALGEVCHEVVMTESDADLALSARKRWRSRGRVSVSRSLRNFAPLSPRGGLRDASAFEVGLPWKRRHGAEVHPGHGSVLLRENGDQVVQRELDGPALRVGQRGLHVGQPVEGEAVLHHQLASAEDVGAVVHDDGSNREVDASHVDVGSLVHGDDAVCRRQSLGSIHLLKEVDVLVVDLVAADQVVRGCGVDRPL